MNDEYRKGYQDGRALSPGIHSELEALKKAIRWLVARERDEYVDSQTDMILERERKLANKFTCPVEPVAQVLIDVLETE